MISLLEGKVTGAKKSANQQKRLNRFGHKQEPVAPLKSRLCLALCIAAFSAASSAAAPPDEALFGGTWTAQVPGLGWIAVDYTGQAQGQMGPRGLWWFVELVPITGTVEGTRLRTFYVDQRGRKQEGLIFTLTDKRKLRLEPGGILSDPLMAPFAGLELDRVGDDQWYSLTNNYYATSQWGRWHSAGELKALPADWPAPLATTTALFLSGQVHQLARALEVRTLTPELLNQAFQWTLEKPRWDDQKEWIQRVIAANPSCDRATLELLWSLPHKPEIWRRVASNVHAAPDWLSQYADRILGASPSDQVLALHDQQMPAELVEKLAQTGSAEALSGVTQHPNATAHALGMAFERSRKEHGTGPYLWEHLAARPDTPAEVLQEIAQTAIKGNAGQMLAALAANSSCPPEIHREVAEARFNAVFGAGQPPYNYGSGPLADPYLNPSHILEWIDLPVPSVRAAIASNPSLTDDQLKKLAADPSELVSRRALENWRRRHPSEGLPPRPASAGKQSSFRDQSEIRDMIDNGQIAQAAKAWQRIPGGLKSQLGQVTYWEKSMGSPAPLLDFISDAESRGGPLAENLLVILVRDAPEYITEMQQHGLLEKIAPFRALSAAIGTGRASTVHLLLEAGLTPNCYGDGGVSPLKMAAEKGDVAVVRLLLEHGADKHARDGNMRNAAACARQAFRVETFALLAESPTELGQLKKLRELMIPASDNSPWVGRWTNRRDGFNTVVVGFEKDGSFGFGSATLGLRGGWRVVQAGRAVATPIWFEEDMTPTQKRELDKLKSVVGELVFEQLEAPRRLQLKLGNQIRELFPESTR